MALNYKTGALDDALKAIEHEALPSLSDYEKTKLAIELLKVVSLNNAIDAIKDGLGGIREAVEMHE